VEPARIVGHTPGPGVWHRLEDSRRPAGGRRRRRTGGRRPGGGQGRHPVPVEGRLAGTGSGAGLLASDSP